MKRSIQDFKGKISALDLEIKNHYDSYGIKDGEFLYDGIINIDEYYNSPLKILWILKEPYSGGGRTMLNDLNLNRAEGNKKDSHTTWHPIIYVAHGILNNFEQFDSMPKIQDDKTISKALRKIAFINIQKTPAATRTNPNDISQAYDRHKEILLKQLEVYNPNIIIGANTLHLFVKDLKLKQENKFKHHWTKEGTLYIKTYHPAQTVLKRDDYVNRIINVSKEWWTNY